MKKYWIVIKNQWDEMLTYRLSFSVWRIRTVLQFLSIYFLWMVLIPKDQSIAGYTQSLILTYILGTSFIDSFVFSSRTYAIGEHINKGDLSNFLLRPINYFSYWFARDIGDKAMNMTFYIAEIALLIFLLHPPIFLQTNIFYISLTILSLIIAVMLYFFINFSLGLIGFWSAEVWAPRFIFTVIVYFISGGFFPLDLLPGVIAQSMKLLPFSYLIYFPIKIYLGQLATTDILVGLGISLFWLALCYKLAHVVWLKGLQVYTAQGR